MAETNTGPAGGRAGTIDRLKSGAAVLGAVAGAITGLYGVYEKVRSEAKQYTAASYNTLAPQMNQMGEALKQLQQENQQLREIVAVHQGTPRIATKPAAARKPPASGTRRPAVAAGSSTTAPAQPAPPAQPAAQPAAGSGPAPAAPGEPSPPAPAGEPQPGTAQAPGGTDPIGGLLSTVGRTRAAIESLRKVPEDFEKVLGKKDGAQGEKDGDKPATAGP